ncbi:MAG: response regulator transcription factor [Planctomycetota bacterium]
MVKVKSAARKSRAKNVAEFDHPKKRRPFEVFLIVDNSVERSDLAKALATTGIPVREYMTAREFRLDYRENTPGVVVAEYRLRDMLATRLKTDLEASEIEVPFVLLISPADSSDGIKAMRYQGADFVVKSTADHKLPMAVRRAYSHWYDTDWEYVAIDLDFVDECMLRLTDREHEVLKLMSNGHSSREIGRKLKVSVKTVEAHRSRISDKLRADDLADLCRMICALHEDADS